MLKFLAELIIMGAAVIVGAHLVPGVSVDGFGTAIIAAILIALANATLGLVLRILTFPVNFLTLGLISFIISVLMILLVSSMLEGFHASGFFPAAVFAIVLSIVKLLFKMIAPKDK